MKTSAPLLNSCAVAACFAGLSLPVEAEPWTPAELINLEFWLDAADEATVTVDEFDRVSQWGDKSGHSRNVAQGRSDRRPAYSATGWGGILPALEFTSYGAQKDTLGRNVSADGISGSAYTLFVVVDAQSLDGEEWIHTAYTTQIHPSPGSENRHQINNNGVKVRSDSNNGGTASGAYVGGPQILQFTLDDMASEILRNGVQIAGSSGTYTPYALSGDYTINGRNSRDGHAGMSGSLAEWIYLSENPSTEDRQLVEGYLAHKWGLAGDLPDDHPYKGAAPGVDGLGFAITEMEYSPDDSMLTLIWTSRPGERYTVKFSRDVGGWDGNQDGDLGDGILASEEDDTTTETFDISEAGLQEDARVYFRIEIE